MAQRKAHKVEDRERTDDIHIEESVDFNGMYLSDHVQQGLKSSGFERPSPIQLAAIPLGRCGLDLVVQAKSGTGKTCVFTVIALEMISVSAPTTQVLVIAPTREIAVQITQVINAIGSAIPGLRAFTFIGGIHLSEDKAKLHCCHIAVGTPGRLTQLVELGLLKVDNIRLFVLDEADQLLTGQFTESVVHLASALPLNKQIIALSATYTDDIAKVAGGLMRSPNHVRLGRDSPALLGVNQFVRLLPYHHQPHRRQQIKLTELMALLATVTFNQCLVFSSSQLRAESICNALRASGWPVSYLTGGQTQSDRLQALEALCSYKCRVLVSTDLSARGLDSEHVNLVVNLDMPRDHATYLHRVGRAGRFGSRGGAITLVTEGDEWQAMRAIASLANVRVYLLQEGWKSSIANNDVKSMEELEFLSDNELQLWLKNNSSQVYGSKKNGKTKEAMEKGSKGNEKVNKLRGKNTIKDTNESFEDSSKENREDNTNSKQNSCNSKNFKVSKEGNDTYSKVTMTDRKNRNRRIKDQHRERENKRIATAARKKEEEAAQIKKENYQKVLTLLEGINSKQSSVSISYSNIQSQCAEKYDSISAADNPNIQVPSLLFTLNPTKTDFEALHDYWKTVKEEHEHKVICVDEMWVGSGTVVHEGLEALIEGNDALTVLNKDQGETCRLTNKQTSVSLAQENGSFYGESCENPIGNEATALTVSVTYKENEGKQFTINEVQKSSKPRRSTVISGSDVTDYSDPKNRREKILSKSNGFRQNGHTRHNKKPPNMYKYNDTGVFNREQCQSNMQSTEIRHSKNQASFTVPDNSQACTLNYAYDKTCWGQWDYGIQSVYDCHNKTQKRHNSSNAHKQHNHSHFQENSDNPQNNTFGNYQSFEKSQLLQPDSDYYCNNYANYSHDYSYSAYWRERAYIESAHKFASMMDYVQTMGRMSAWMAEDFHKRNKESDS